MLPSHEEARVLSDPEKPNVQDLEEDGEFDVMKSYSFIHGVVPRFHYTDPEAHRLIQQQSPVILTGSNLAAPALKWDLPYLTEHIGMGPFAVYSHQNTSTTTASPSTSTATCSYSQDNKDLSDRKDCSVGEGLKKTETQPPSPSCSTPRRINIFKYFDDKKVQSLQDKTIFKQDIVREEMSFDDFLKKYKGDRSKERVYLQQPLTNAVGRQIAADFLGFNWSWVKEKQKEWDWGPLTSNLLLIGQKGNVTPVHYDEQQNLFCQLQGSKRFILFSPDNFRCLYPYPVHHPHDRQSQVDLDKPDLHRFPNFCDASAVEAIIQPGEVIYIPMYYWHHVINSEDTIAINFWHKGGPTTEIEYPLQSRQKVAMIRNVEKMLLDALQDQRELSNILHCMVDGRF